MGNDHRSYGIEKFNLLIKRIIGESFKIYEYKKARLEF